MNLYYALSEDDFLICRVFAASKSKVTRKKRIRTRLIISIGSLVVALMFYLGGNKIMTSYFVVFGVVYFIMNISRGNNFYKMLYRKHIQELYKNRVGQPFTVTIKPDRIECLDMTGSRKINMSEFEYIIETNGYYFLKMRTGGHFIIPKSNLESPEGLNQELIKIAKDYKIPFKLDKDF